MKKARILLGLLCLLAIVGGVYYQKQEQAEIDITGPVVKADTKKIKVGINADDAELIRGVSARDEKDGDVSDSIVIESVTKKADGSEKEFFITYAAFDDSSNASKLTRRLIYTDYQKPHFSIKAPLRFPANQPVNLFDSIQAEDCLDGDITPFITLEGDEGLQGEPQKGFYNCTLTATNSVGDTAELPVVVEVFEDGYEDQMTPQVMLTDYLVYIKKGDAFDPNTYLDYVRDRGHCLIDYGAMVDVYKGGKWQQLTEQIANGSEELWVNISQISITSDVNPEEKGIYSVIYSYTAPETGYGCNTRLIVVVE